jgi:ubiquinone/menaquinone biosynthesis C-methylase UbiE
MPPPLSAEEIRDVNMRYHDVAADGYDSKWAIDFGEIGSRQVMGKLAKALGATPGRYRRSLEIGAGTGYFSLNMLRDGIVERATATDISPGMLDTLRANAARLGLNVSTMGADAERLPFAAGSFDLVFGHAVLHHIPDLPRAFGEFARVLSPGGVLIFAGEPSRYGDRVAALPKRVAARAAPLWRRAMGARPARPSGSGPSEGHSLEGVVDVHAFSPGELSAMARQAGFERVRITGEELLANWFGWANRTLEASADPDSVPWAWRQYAYRGYLLLQEVDRRLLESRLPPAIFYNLMIAAHKPADTLG